MSVVSSSNLISRPHSLPLLDNHAEKERMNQTAKDGLASIRTHQLISIGCQNGFISKDKMSQLIELGVTSEELRKINDNAFKLLGGGGSQSVNNNATGNSGIAYWDIKTTTKTINASFTGEVICTLSTGEFADKTVTFVCKDGLVDGFTCPGGGMLSGLVHNTYRPNEGCYKDTVRNFMFYEGDYTAKRKISRIAVSNDGTRFIVNWIQC